MNLLDLMLWLLGLGRKLKPPTSVNLLQIGGNMPANAKLTWSASPSNPPNYKIQWYWNGNPSGLGLYNVGGAIGGLNRLFTDDNPGITLVDGDTVRAEVAAYNGVTGAVSIFVSSPTITISITPPPLLPPTNVGLVQI